MKPDPECLNREVEFLGMSPLGNVHDFYSEGDYWWPDPDNPSGPYVRRDGQINPGNFNCHRERLLFASRSIANLAVYFFESGDERALFRLKQWLKGWFLDPDTRMTPDLEHAQAIHGICTGRGIGIIDTIHLAETALACRILKNSNVLEADFAQGLTDWFSAYLDWLLFSPNGVEEHAQANNHGTAWSFQAAAFGIFLGRENLLDELRLEFKNRWLGTMAEDGSFPLELARTRPFAYSIFQLELMCGLAFLLSTPEENLFRVQRQDGRGMSSALHFLLPKLADPLQWHRAPDVILFHEQRRKLPFLLLCGGLESLYQSLPDPADEFELLRCTPIRTPRLWHMNR